MRVLVRTGLLFGLCFLVTANSRGQEESGTASIGGQVVDQSGGAIVGAQVKVLDARGSALQTATTDGSGRFSLTGLPPGRYVVQVESQQFETARVDVQVNEGTPVPELRIKLKVSGTSEKVNVVGQRENVEGYAVQVANTGTRTNVPLLDLPLSIQVVDRKLLNDQQVFQFGDALSFVAGIQRATTVTTGAIGNEFSIRGFQLDPYNNYLRDGIKFPGTGQTDTADVEQIEVLKGPAAALYGRAEAGGVVNLVSKKPTEGPMASLQFTGGNWNFFRPQFDISGPLNSRGTFLYRLNGVYENRESFRDFVKGRRYFVAPYFLWKVNGSTTLSFYGEFLNEDRVSDYGIPAFQGRPAPVPVSTFYDEPWNNEMDRDRQAGYRFHHSFNADWSLDNSYLAARSNSKYLEVYNSNPTANGLSVRRSVDNFAFPVLNQYSITDLSGRIKTGAIKNNVLIGFEGGWTANSSSGAAATAPAVSILNPIIGQFTLAQALVALQNPRFVNASENDVHTVAGYLQDQIELSRRWKALLGARFERYAQDTIDHAAKTLQRQSDVVTSPRAGLVFQPVPTLSLYASFVQSFIPTAPAQLNTSRTQFSPEKDRQYEAGLKKTAMAGRLTGTLAFYYIQKRNVLVPDPTDSRFSVQTGKVRSKGAELEIIGTVLPGWNVLASYSFIQAQVITDTRYQPGNVLPNAPRHSGAIWNTYEIPRGLFRGLGLSAGVLTTGSRAGNLQNSFLLPGYARVDAGAYYTYFVNDKNTLRLSVNIQNALDRRYYASSSTNEIRPGAPLTALVGLRWTYR